VVVNGREDDQRLAGAVAAVRERAKGQVIAVAADVGAPGGAMALAKSAFDSFRRIDILVNNAGILREGLIGMVTDVDMRAMIDTNLVGVLNTTQAVARVMARRKAGAIVNVASIMGRRGYVGQFVYSATKAGVIGATLASAKEFARVGVRVNAVAPGYIETDMTGHVTEAQKADLIGKISLGRPGSPEDVADAIWFLVSDLARYVTGQVLGVDGGMVA
jgi:3-oxoacyl-[acyl-carrier protein] reductase